MTETVLITGADKGLGFSLTRRFLQAGAQVFAGSFADPDGLTGLAKEYPQTLNVLPLDVSAMDSIVRAVQQVRKSTPGLDVLINNAGVHIEKEAALLEELDFTDGHLERTLAVNTFGPLRTIQQFLPLLKEGRRKLIINISSEAGSIADCPRGGEFAYCMSKSALNMQSKILQNYLGPQRFKVLAVHPGWMRTDMGGQSADISSDQAAEGIFKLAGKDWSPQDEIYLDYQGKALRW
jgi:NAD(P)-dependent dehydrogenase (short-subunit alcohol dehydrogenase family)